MTLLPDTRLGPYEILSPLGAGGMGEVWKAKDTRLDRFVAVKVLPEHLSKNPESLVRFEREAKAVAALNHPNILGIHDFATQGDTTYVVMELLEGESLRMRLESGPLTPRKATELAIQMAQGLAAAHEKGVVHRDLKPDNLWITKEGRLKILDFGLAKQMVGMGAGSDSFQPTAAIQAGHNTEKGLILGTLGYMSPEQVRGEALDARADLFSFGVVLFEMLTGKKAFSRATASDTMAAILRDDPPEVEGTSKPIPLALRRIIDHCLEKIPDHRFRDAHDVAFALENFSSPEASAVISVPFAPQNRRTTRIWAVVAATVVMAAGFAGWALRGSPAALPTFHLLTHEQGTLGEARFIPGSPEVIYGAQWAGGPPVWCAQRLDQAGNRVIQGGDGRFLAVAPNGETLGLSDTYLVHGQEPGRLFTLPLQGGAKREWTDKVLAACPDAEAGGLAAVVGEYGHQFSLEWPLGHPIYNSPTSLRFIRVRGDRVALFQEQGDSFENGLIQLVDRQGLARTLATLSGVTGLAWSPDGSEVWVSVFREGQSRFLALDLHGRMRTLLTHAERLEIEDVDSSGRVLAALHAYQRQTFGRGPGETQDHDLGWLAAQATLGISADGTTILLASLGDWATVGGGTLYVRPLKGGPALNAGEGTGQPTLSAKGDWIVAAEKKPEFCMKLIPTRGGSPRSVPLPGFGESAFRAELCPDGRTVILWGRLKGGPMTFYSLDLASGTFRAISPPECVFFTGQKVVSPDGLWLAFNHQDGSSTDGSLVAYLMRSDGTDFHRAPPLKRNEAVVGWGADSRSLYVIKRTGLPVKVERMDITTGKRSLVLRLSPPDPAGIPGIVTLQLTPDARNYAYNITRKLSKLYLIEGLK